MDVGWFVFKSIWQDGLQQFSLPRFQLISSFYLHFTTQPRFLHTKMKNIALNQFPRARLHTRGCRIKERGNMKVMVINAHLEDLHFKLYVQML